ncbi:MAG: YbaB/EbfC family nucleoid-associated protein [Patescibacteria group bacterium]|nr:YbaB/EbfC family nucleoid-associated protein [Patescibacteria group bacterium]
MFDQAKDLYKIQKQAKKIKKELAKLHIEAEVEGVIVTINGEQEVVDVKIPEDKKNHPKLEQFLLQAFNKAIKKSQQIAADRMKDVMDQMGLSMPSGSGQ